MLETDSPGARPPMHFREKLHLTPGMGLIFDLDGVIIDSMPFHQRAWQRYLEVTGIGSSESLDFMHGQRNEEIVQCPACNRILYYEPPVPVTVPEP